LEQAISVVLSNGNLLLLQLLSALLLQVGHSLTLGQFFQVYLLVLNHRHLLLPLSSLSLLGLY